MDCISENVLIFLGREVNMNCMQSVRLMELGNKLERLKKQTEFIILNVRCFIARGNSLAEFLKSIQCLELYLRCQSAAEAELNAVVNDLVELNRELEQCFAERSNFCKALFSSFNVPSFTKGGKDNQSSLCVTCAKEKTTTGTNTDSDNESNIRMCDSYYISKLYGLGQESIVEMRHLQGDCISSFWLGYYDNARLQTHLTEVKQKLCRMTEPPAVGQFFIGCLDPVFRGYVLSVQCGLIAALDIDTGVLKMLSEHEACEIEDSLSQCPPQAIRCKLWSIPDNLEWCKYLNLMFGNCLRLSNLVVTVKNIVPGAIPTFVVDVDAHCNLLDVNLSEWINSYVVPVVEKLKLSDLPGVVRDSIIRDLDPWVVLRKEHCSNSNVVVSEGSFQHYENENIQYGVCDSLKETLVLEANDLIFNCGDHTEKIALKDSSKSSILNYNNNSQVVSINSVNESYLSENVKQISLKQIDHFDSVASSESSEIFKSIHVRCVLEKDRMLGMLFLSGNDPWDFILHYVPKQEVAAVKRKIADWAETGLLEPFFKRPQVGHFAVGKFDDEYCRVRVTDVITVDDVRVVDIDSGETKKLCWEVLWVLGEAFSFPPALAVKCSLWNIPRKPFYWNTDLQDLFRKVMTAAPLHVRVDEVDNISNNWRHIVQICVLGDYKFDVSQWIMLFIFPKLRDIKQYFDAGLRIDYLHLDPEEVFKEEPTVSNKLQQFTYGGNSESVLSETEVCTTSRNNSSVSKLQRANSGSRVDHKSCNNKGNYKLHTKKCCNDDSLNFKKCSFVVESGKKYYALLSHVVSPSEFYIHIVSDEHSLIDKLHKDLQYCYLKQKVSFRNKLEARQCISQCCAVYHRSKWWRGRVMDWLEDSSDKVEVCLVDYGMHTIVSFESLQSLKREFYVLPLLAQRCSLAGISSPGNDCSWPQGSLDGFLSFFHRDTVYEICIDQIIEPEESFSIFLSLGEKMVSINDYLVDAGLAVSQSCSDATDRPGAGLFKDFPSIASRTAEGLSDKGIRSDNLCGIENVEMLPNWGTNIVDLPVVGDLLSVVIMEVINIGSFYGVRGKCLYERRLRNTQDVLIEMSEKIGAAMQTEQVEPSKCLVTGTLVAAQYSEDGLWYRACLLSTVDNKGFFKVFFVDYGNVGVVHKRYIKKMRNEFRALPFQAIRFFIGDLDITKLTDTYAQKEAICLLNALTEEVVVVQVLRVINRNVSVKVLHNKRDIGLEILNIYHRECKNM